MAEERRFFCSDCTDSTLKKYVRCYQPTWRVGEYTFLLLNHIFKHSLLNHIWRPVCILL